MWKVRKSKIHGSGVFATEDIKSNTKIIEYIGEKITKKEGDRRSEIRIKKYLNSKTNGSVYIFELNKKYDIDGSFLYNKARYINHSCSPNCEVNIIRGKIWISSIKKISEGEELSYDYGYEFDKDDYKDHKCKCGSKKCIGFIISSDDRYKYRRYRKKINDNKRKNN
jgi:SET domain-containing protein|tara:strand:- start:123 stop:623 length:501 start_codon:yes stop_codon:yes gene_type:complete